MTVSGRSAVAAWGRQTAEGTGLASPKFETPMGSGGIQPARDIQELPWTNEGRDSIGHFVSRTSGEFSMDLPVLPISSASLLYAALGSLATATGVQTITPADSLPFLTMWFGMGGEYLKLVDSKVGTLQLSGSAGQPLNFSISGQGKTVTRTQPAAKWSAATVDEAVEPFFTYIGGVLKLEAATTPAATTVRNLPNFEFTVENNLDAIQTDGIGYQILGEGNRAVSMNHTDVVLEDWNFIKTVFTGSTTGTTLSSVPVYGSALHTVQDTAGGAEMTIATPRVLWNIAQWPGADTSGTPVRYSLTGMGSKPTSGAISTVTVDNGDAGTSY